MKPCRQCSKPFEPARPLQAVCSRLCAKREVMEAKKTRKALERAQTRARRESLLRIPDRIAIAQKEFNAYVRLRDSGQPCICCGKPLGDGDVGGAYDAGHFRSTGTAPHLRFDERNAHGQRKYCNRWGAGRAVDYRAGLAARLGLDAVIALETDNRVHKWQHDELIEIAARYKAKRKELEVAA